MIFSHVLVAKVWGCRFADVVNLDELCVSAPLGVFSLSIDHEKVRNPLPRNWFSRNAGVYLSSVCWPDFLKS